jgi:hypothetical protein
MQLFLSFSGLLCAIVRNEVSQEELGTALFYFGCTRAHALNPGDVGEFDERITYRESGPIAQGTLRALDKAELTGRCRGHRPDDGIALPAYPLVDELLVADGVPTLTLRTATPDYTYFGARDIVKEAGLPVEVHF